MTRREHRFLPLSNGRGRTLIDQQDYSWASKTRWRLLRCRSPIGYAAGRIDGKHVVLHRLVIGAAEGEIVDHINRNPLDNRRRNLRIVTRGENKRNSGPPDKYKGVFPYTVTVYLQRYRALITVDGRKIYGPPRETEEQAALDFDEMTLTHFGELAFLNFPGKHPRVTV